MAKHTNQEAYFQRLKNLANVDKPSLKESKFRNLGSLIDYKRASDGVAYGIIKENHSYYLKKAGTKQDPNVADFAYIGGMENITGYQYKSLAEADKQRNMIFHTINEAAIPKVDKNGSKKKLNEDLAGKEIDQAASKLGSLDAATSAEAQPAPVAPEGGDEMAAGLDAKPAGETPAEEPAPEGGPAPDLGGDPESGPAPDLGGGDEELPPADDTEAGTDEVPATDDENPDASAGGPEGDGNDAMTDLQKSLGKITNTIRKTEMEDVEVKGLVNTFLASFKDKLRDMDIEDRKEMANKLLKVVGNDEIEDLGDSIPQDKPEGSELGPEAGLGSGKEPEIAEEEQPCAECGGLPEYAKSRGYETPESFMECGDEEKANVISGYANAHNDGQNDGDFKTVAIVITPEILEKLKSEYGHEDYANQVEPFSKEMNESSDEDKMAQLNELWGGLGNAFKKVGGDIKSAGQAVGSAVGGAVQKGAQAVGNVAKAGAEKVGQYATNVKQSYNAGEVPAEVKKLQGVAANLGKQIDALNKRMTAAGQQPIDVKTILKAVTQQVTGKGAGIGGLNPAIAEGANGVDPSNTVVSEPNMLKETDKKVAPGNKVVSEPNMLKEDDETEEPEKEFDVDAIETPEGGEETGEVGIEPEVSDEPETKPEIGFAPAAQTLGAGVVKADGAGVEIKVEPDKTVTLTMNESEIKLRKYVRQRLQEKAGLRKPMLTESKKSVNLKKLDAMIDEQFKLYEGKVIKKKSRVNEVFGWSIAEKFAKLDPNDEAGVKALFQEAFKNILINPMMSVISTAANRATTQEKYELLRQFVEGGGGTLRLDKAGKLIYASKEFQDKGTRSQFGQGGTQGKTQMGGI